MEIKTLFQCLDVIKQENELLEYIHRVKQAIPGVPWDFGDNSPFKVFFNPDAKIPYKIMGHAMALDTIARGGG